MSDGSDGSFWDHLEDFRRTLIRCIAVIGGCAALCLFFHQGLFALIERPLDAQNSLYLLAPTEGLVTTLHLCCWAGLALSSPAWLLILTQFIAPGLHTQERRLLLPFILCSILAFGLGLLFALECTIPLANDVLGRFNMGLGENLWTLQHYIRYSVVLMLGTSIAFEVAVLIFFLAHCGRISAAGMRRQRRPVIVAIFVLAALLTPPDVLTQVMLALPLVGLYELAIIYAQIRELRARERAEIT